MALMTSPTSVLSLSPENEEEGSRHFVLPGEREPFLGGGLDENLHASRHAAHIRRATQNDGIGSVQLVQARGSLLRSVDLGVLGL
jgi:hypothetical protein